MLHGFLIVQHGLHSFCSNGYRANIALLKLHKSVTFQLEKRRDFLQEDEGIVMLNLFQHPKQSPNITHRYYWDAETSSA